MFAVTGITGQVGGAVAHSLLKDQQAVRAVVRSESKAKEWADQGAEITTANFNDIAALTAAFTGAEGVFIMIPPDFAPEAGFPKARSIIQALRAALDAASPGKVVVLSSVGAQHDHGLGLITQLYILEQELGTLPIPIAFLRPAWFLENSLWDVPSAKEGAISSFLQPLDRPFPMVATADIGSIAAQTLQETWTGQRIIEIEGPRPYSQNEIAAVFAGVLGHPVQAEPVPRDEWAGLFESQGAAPSGAASRIEMLDGFNSGWIEFEGAGAQHLRGTVTLEEVLASA